MCGIWGYIAYTKPMVKQLFEASQYVKPRGPDTSTFKQINNIFIAFHRLAIMDPSNNGDQPFMTSTPNRNIYAICNGEIYNYKSLTKQYDITLKSNSDCEILPYLYQKLGFKTMLEQLRGEFAICIIDIDHINNSTEVWIARDQLAVRPVFIGYDDNGFAFSSILKGLVNIVEPTKIRQLKRAECINLKLEYKHEPVIHSDIFHKLPTIVNDNYTFETIRSTFIEAVHIRMASDKPLGALLSGGLDSSLVVSIAARYLKQYNKKLHTFSIGIPGSTDRKYAEMVAKHCGTVHTHIEFQESDFLNAINSVILAIESYDITTVRASVGQYLISKWIAENTDIKVLLIGDGSDELCSGYMYFHNAPNSYASHQENVRLIDDIYYYDALRADRCIAYNGLEARVPFLDHHFVDLYLSIPYDDRIPRQEPVNNNRATEKWLLRKSFDVDNYLPLEVLWRKKEAFSDGVSSQQRSWFQVIQEMVEPLYTDYDFKDATIKYHLEPLTKEALHYRKIFNRYFDPYAAHVIPYYWLPKWSGNITDPSARVLDVYNE
jgi:asparagine synthase (glutamine-hydrolysing)